MYHDLLNSIWTKINARKFACMAYLMRYSLNKSNYVTGHKSHQGHQHGTKEESHGDDCISSGGTNIVPQPLIILLF